ncbi:hypothetical protein [Caldicellulosiruptor acetigenus]|nr:hypothetical protein [Caldicellulosiruptor acetigenus]WAM37207.1 hypothetical protein OTK01_001039 [Caldicellulosiruptor acetigenus]
MRSFLIYLKIRTALESLGRAYFLSLEEALDEKRIEEMRGDEL